jgi:hypothetical protein
VYFAPTFKNRSSHTPSMLRGDFLICHKIPSTKIAFFGLALFVSNEALLYCYPEVSSFVMHHISRLLTRNERKKNPASFAGFF